MTETVIETKSIKEPGVITNLSKAYLDDANKISIIDLNKAEKNETSTNKSIIKKNSNDKTVLDGSTDDIHHKSRCLNFFIASLIKIKKKIIGFASFF
jgi:hypothetical protein